MSINNFTRRQFGLTVAGTLAASGTVLPGAGSQPASEPRRLPREVWVASVCLVGLKAQTPQEMCAKVLNRMEEVVPYKPDIVCTPETFPFVGLPGGRPNLSEVAESRTGPILDQFAGFARRHHCYVICSTYTREAGHYYNASVLFDREGHYVGEYRKINPDEGEIERNVTPGPLEPPVFKTDFGTIGMQICYDVNWYDNWRRLGDAGAQIVFWPSFFAGGMMLNSHAWMNKFYVVSSAQNEHPTKIISPLGKDIVSTGRIANWVCAPINLDFAVVQTVDYLRKLEELSKKYGRAFRIQILNVEALASIEGISGDISVAEALKEFDILTSKEMIAVATRMQIAKRPA